jgi:hypothetical protein
MAVKKRIRTFTLPGEEVLIENIENDKDCEIIDKKIIPCPKDAIILVYLEYNELIDNSFEDREEE